MLFVSPGDDVDNVTCDIEAPYQGHSKLNPVIFEGRGSGNIYKILPTLF